MPHEQYCSLHNSNKIPEQKTGNTLYVPGLTLQIVRIFSTFYHLYGVITNQVN